MVISKDVFFSRAGLDGQPFFASSSLFFANASFEAAAKLISRKRRGVFQEECKEEKRMEKHLILQIMLKGLPNSLC